MTTLSWLLHALDAFITEPPLGPTPRQVAGLLHAAEAAWALEGAPGVTRALHAARQRLDQGLPAGQIVPLAARGAELSPTPGLARAWLALGQRAAQTITDPTAGPDAWATLLRAAASVDQPDMLRHAPRPAAEDDPWAQVRLWLAWLVAAQRWPNAPAPFTALRGALLQWDDPFVALALREAAATLHDTRARPLVEDLWARARRMTDAYSRAQAWAILARLTANHEAAAEAARAAQEVPVGPYRGEALAWAARAWIAVAARDHATPLLEQAVAEAERLGYMDDRARVLRAALPAYEALGAIAALVALWPLIAEIGYPRFFAPLAAMWVRALRCLGATHDAAQGWLYGMDWAAREPAPWQQVVLLQHLLRAWPEPETLHQGLEQARAIPEPRYRGQALAEIARLWREAYPDRAPWAALWQAAHAVPAVGPRQEAAVAALQGWAMVAPEDAQRAARDQWDAFVYPDQRGAALAALAGGWRAHQRPR